MQLARTLAMGINCRGSTTCLTKAAFSTSDDVDVPQVCVKNENGTNPHIANTGKFGIFGGNTFVNTKVRMETVTTGFSNDQKTPSDIFRYRTLKSFRTSWRSRNP